jgi:deoxyribodipyrimidine photo-lyase
MAQDVNVFWFRRDLRTHDNRGLFEALSSGLPVLGVFVFDKTILDRLEDKTDARVSFLHQTLEDLSAQFAEHGSSLLIEHSTPKALFSKLLKSSDFKVHKVFTNRDYEPYASERDASIAKFLGEAGVEFESFKDHVIFHENEVVKDDAGPYVVFTPYKRKWLARAKERAKELKPVASENNLGQLVQWQGGKAPSLEDMGFRPTEISIPGKSIKKQSLVNYGKDRDFPAIDGTSRLGLHLRFGTTSIRRAVEVAYKTSDVWLSELIWREFYSQVMWHYPHSATGSFRTQYDEIDWRNNDDDFEAWKQGQTGYPIVDAGMRELVATGYMHNRVRMITASFLTKHLLIDWRWGERFFARHLLDFDLASNVGGWQWAAGSGTDAAPYFRIFNPESQLKKFDKDMVYTRKWVPELETSSYPDPIVGHKMARERCLDVYKKALKPS